MNSVAPPENILRCLTPDKRRELGQKNKAEVMAAGEIASERELQKQIKSYLSYKGVEVFDQRMDKRTRGKTGQPDFLFAYHGIAHAWEIKLPGRNLEPHQAQMAVRLMSPPNLWRHQTVTSLEQAKSLIDGMNIGKDATTKAELIAQLEPYPDDMPVRTSDNPFPKLEEVPWTDPAAEDDRNFLLLV